MNKTPEINSQVNPEPLAAQTPAAKVVEKPKKTFLDLGVPPSEVEKLTLAGLIHPTPIQELAIPVALLGKDILGSAQTGTGKTAAFAIPLVMHLIKNPNSHALVMAPTRELANQVLTQIQRVQDRSPIPSVLLIGGEPISNQLRQLRYKPRVFVGTPGRIYDHLERRKFLLEHVDFLVLDETDRMLDMGFADQIKSILDEVSTERQTLMFSATIPKDIEHIANKYLKNPERVSAGAASKPAELIKQEAKFVTLDEKYDALKTILSEQKGSVIVFVKTKKNADKLSTRLYKDDLSCQAIHGDLAQQKRDRVLDSFRKKRHKILVATDVAARGLDIPHVELVVNFDMPQSPEDYVHRIGRTARAGASGLAINLITGEDQNLWKAITRFLSPKSGKGESHSTQNRPSSRAKNQRRTAGGFSRNKSYANSKESNRNDNRRPTATFKKPFRSKTTDRPR